MSLLLSGTEIKGSNIKVKVTQPLAGEDLSGQSSMTAQAETGDKPKQVMVTMEIRFDDARYLKSLTNLAGAKDSNGERVIYQISNRSAQAMNLRQVKFQGELVAAEAQQHKMWRVSFKLVEYRSVPEVKEARQQRQSVVDQAPTGIITDADGETTTQSTFEVEEVELSGFENYLQRLEEWAASDEA